MNCSYSGSQVSTKALRQKVVGMANAFRDVRNAAFATVFVGSILIFAALAGCRGPWPRYATPAPRVLPEQPTFSQVASVVNANSDRVQSILAPSATVRMTGSPGLRAQIAFHRPRQFRMVANLLGPQVDIGSNDEQFWLWTKQDNRVLYCSHEQFASSAARQWIPVDPMWLPEAFGLVRFSPNEQHTEPAPMPGGRLRIDTTRTELGETTRRVAIIHAASGWVLEQYLYNESGTLLASAVSSGHTVDGITGATLPNQVEITWPTIGMSLHVELGNVQINNSSTGSPDRYAMPQYGGAKYVDLSDPNVLNSGALSKAAAIAPVTADARHSASLYKPGKWRKSQIPR